MELVGPLQCDVGGESGCVRIDGKYGAPGAAFGVLVILGGNVDEFVAFYSTLLSFINPKPH